MGIFTKPMVAIALAVALARFHSSFADSKRIEIRDPSHCPEGLSIKSRVGSAAPDYSNFTIAGHIGRVVRT